jgi:hypothetical protein
MGASAEVSDVVMSWSFADWQALHKMAGATTPKKNVRNWLETNGLSLR